MLLDFKSIRVDEQDRYIEILKQCPQKSSDYSFINLIGWADEYGLRWAWSDGLVWIKQTIPENIYWAPIGPWLEIDWHRLLKKHFSSHTRFERIPEQLALIWEKNLDCPKNIEEAREHWDYLYEKDALVWLKGNRFHKKRNLVNQFKKKYDYEYIPFGLDMIRQAESMQEDWCEWRDCESSKALSAENRAIMSVLSGWEKFKNITGGALFIDQKMIAYTVSEFFFDTTIIIHFEKANVEFKGSYQAINQIHLENLGDEYLFVNREQDLNDKGLRKAKLSYNPVDFIKKYRISIF